MKTGTAITILSFAFLALADLGAVEIPGKVQSVSGNTATISVEGDAIPSVGDKISIFFKMPGLDEEVAVGRGTVTAVGADGITVRVDEATGTVAKDQLVRITSPNPSKKSAAQTSPPPVQPTATPTATAKAITGEVAQMASKIVIFDELPLGPLAAAAFLGSDGIRIEKRKGEPGVYAAEPNMLLPTPSKKVLLIGGDRISALTIILDPPVKRFALYRIGVKGGASMPTWKMTAYDSNGKPLGSAGETRGLPPQAKYFGVDAKGIVRVELTTDNRQGAGTWATWSSLPIAGFGFDR